jgi:hypothetical protein
MVGHMRTLLGATSTSTCITDRQGRGPPRLDGLSPIYTKHPSAHSKRLSGALGPCGDVLALRPNCGFLSERTTRPILKLIGSLACNGSTLSWISCTYATLVNSYWCPHQSAAGGGGGGVFVCFEADDKTWPPAARSGHINLPYKFSICYLPYCVRLVGPGEQRETMLMDVDGSYTEDTCVLTPKRPLVLER